MKPCKKLVAALNFWRSALRIDDWKISVAQASAADLEQGSCRAQVTVQPHQRSATIFLRTLTEFDRSIEEELVHEMGHIVFAQYSLIMGAQDDAGQLPMEQAINAVTEALVRLRYS